MTLTCNQTLTSTQTQTGTYTTTNHLDLHRDRDQEAMIRESASRDLARNDRFTAGAPSRGLIQPSCGDAQEGECWPQAGTPSCAIDELVR